METLPVLRKRSSIIRRRNTSVSLEDDFWDGFREIAKRQKITVSALAETINQDYDQTNLSFAIRVYAFLHTPQRPESSAVSSITPNSSTK